MSTGLTSDETLPNGLRVLTWEPGNGWRYVITLASLADASAAVHAKLGTTEHHWQFVLVGGPGVTWRSCFVRWDSLSAVYLAEKLILSRAEAQLLVAVLDEVLRPDVTEIIDLRGPAGPAT